MRAKTSDRAAVRQPALLQLSRHSSETGKNPGIDDSANELQAMLPAIEDLKMDVRQLVNTTELNLSEEDGFYVIRVKGKKRKTEVEGELLYAGGILNHGYLSVKQESDAGKLITNFIIDATK